MGNLVDTCLSQLVRLVHSANTELLALIQGQVDNTKDDTLPDWLYANWYTRPAAEQLARAIIPGRTSLVPALHAALASTGQWETGWVVLQALPGNKCVAGRNQFTRVLLSGEYANVARPGAPVAPGDGLAVLNRLAWLDEATGFWSARSLMAEPRHPLKRVYFSVGYADVGNVLKQLVPVLEKVGKAWSLKCPGQAHEFDRVDSLVVYVSSTDWPAFAMPIEAILPKLAPYLRDDTPPLTLPFGRGASTADSPLEDLSFGQSRCIALAPGVRTLVSTPGIRPPGALELLKQSLAKHAIDPAAPWKCKEHG